jgi:hypothetical protein
MDPNLLKHMDYFAVPNNQTIDLARQNATASSSSAPATATDGIDAPLWDAATLRTDAGLSDSVSTGPSGASLTSFAQQSTAPTTLSFGSLSGPSPYRQSKSGLPGSTPQAAAPPRRRDGHDRKRARVASEAAALESVDYWIHFDDDDPENRIGESFEIDFSKRRNNAAAMKRCDAPKLPIIHACTCCCGCGVTNQPPGRYPESRQCPQHPDSVRDFTRLAA